MEKYWIFIGHNMLGPYDIPTLWKTEGFCLKTQVCRPGEDEWTQAQNVPTIAGYSEEKWVPGFEEKQLTLDEKKDWRRSVIVSDVQTPVWRTQARMDLAAITRATPVRPPPKWQIFFKDRRDKSLLMVLLWLMMVHVYSPHWGDLGNLYDNCSVGQTEEIGPTHNYSVHPNRGHIKPTSRWKIHALAMLSAAPESLPVANAKSRGKKTVSKLVDQDLETLPDGTVMKVTVVSIEKDGIKTYQTRKQYYQTSHGRLKTL